MEQNPSAIGRHGTSLASATERQYQCPGEHYSISRAIHLARLADAYPACAECPHRADTGTLSSRQVRRLHSAWHQRAQRELVLVEAIAGRCGEELDAREAWRWGAAFGVRLAQTCPGKPIRVVVGSDGRGLSAELLRAASEAVRWTGASTIDCGQTTAPEIAFAQRALEADGAVLIGNPLGLAQTTGMRLWGLSGGPWSSPGELDLLQQIVSSGIDRPGRKSGSSSRYSVHTAYLSAFSEAFHALRPVKFVLRTVCRPVTAALGGLLGNVGCRLVPARRVVAQAGPATAPLAPENLLGEQVRDEHLDFGIWIDSDGEACRVWDETGAPLPGETLLSVLIGASGEDAPRNVVLESDSLAGIAKALQLRGFRVRTGVTTRQAMHEQVTKPDCAWGGGPSGRLWLARHSPAPDALLTLTQLLQVLSRSDRRLSQVVVESLASRQPSG